MQQRRIKNAANASQRGKSQGPKQVASEPVTEAEQVVSEPEATSKPREVKGSEAKISEAKTTREPVRADFVASNADREFARSIGLGDLDVDLEVVKFVAHYQARGTLFADVNAQFRKWLTKKGEFDGHSGKQGSRPQGHLDQEIDKWRASRDLAPLAQCSYVPEAVGSHQ